MARGTLFVQRGQIRSRRSSRAPLACMPPGYHPALRRSSYADGLRCGSVLTAIAPEHPFSVLHTSDSQ